MMKALTPGNTPNLDPCSLKGRGQSDQLKAQPQQPCSHRRAQSQCLLKLWEGKLCRRSLTSLKKGSSLAFDPHNQ